MDTLFHAHSGLRYLVLLFGAVATVWFAFGRLTGRPFEGIGRGLFAALIAVVDLQVLIGLFLLFGRLGRPGVELHAALMVTAAVALHAASIVQRRRAPGYGAPLIGVLVTLGLIVVGIGALGRPLF